MTGISAFIVCKNEAASIERCLESISWCDEIVIVDSGSTDATLEICARHNCRISHREWTGYVHQKSHALSLCTRPWILNLDADEEVSPELRDEIRAMLESDGGAKADGSPSGVCVWLAASVSPGMARSRMSMLACRDP